MLSKENFKKKLPLFFGIISAVVIGFLEGIGVNEVILDQIIGSIKRGDYAAFMGFCLVFVLLWLQLWGLKKAVLKLNETIANSFARGETRFTEIENRQHLNEDRLTAIELIMREKIK